MAAGTVLRYAPSTLYRVSYRSPIELPPWKFVGGGRFDDPQESYRVLYTSLTAVGACVERFQDYRRGEYEAFEADFEFDKSAADLGPPPEVPNGHLPFDHYALLFLGGVSIPHDTTVMDLTVDETARYFSGVFRRDLTVSDLVADRDYNFTPLISRIGFEDSRRIGGIYSASKIDPVEVQNVTLYEGDSEQLRVQIQAEHVESVSETTEPLVEACASLGITIETAEQYHARRMSETGF